MIRKALKYLISAFVLLVFQACEKKDDTKEVRGCQDINSTNYNPNATVADGSCKYPSDAYVGNYIATDTISYIDPGTNTLVTNTQQYSFSIAKTDYNKVMALNFYSCDTATATVTATNLTFINPINECGFTNFIGRLTGGKLRYTYDYATFSVVNVKGTAVKQL